MDKEPDDLEDVIREETSRGRRPVDTDAQRQRRLLRRDYRKLIREGTEKDFIAALRALGLQEGSSDFVSALKIWRGLSRR